MSEQQSQPTTSVKERPAPEGFGSWNEYWTKKHNQPWRTQPEIDEERQRFLAARIPANTNFWHQERPWGGVSFTRADIEWLLASHEGGRGPIDWNDEAQRKREGVYLRGADLQGLYLSGLPLAGAYLEYALLGIAGERRGSLSEAHLEGAWLTETNLANVDLREAHLKQAHLGGADLTHAFLRKAHLQGADLRVANLSQATAEGVHLESAFLRGTTLREAKLIGAHLEGAFLGGADLEGADLRGANLKGTVFSEAPLEGPFPAGARADLDDRVESGGARLDGADMREAILGDGTRLKDASLAGVRLADMQWNDVNLAVMYWGAIPILADELIARKRHLHRPPRKPGSNVLSWYEVRSQASETLDDYEAAVRANRQVSMTLRAQGISEHADRFAYRSLRLQRQLLRYRRRYIQASGSWFLDLISGYGYRPMRSFITYIVVVGVFALTYYLLGSNVNPPLDPLGAIVFSITSFHGRGFAPGENVLLNNPLTVIAAGEAIIGLLIEITFIATFTQRFFAR